MLACPRQVSTQDAGFTITQLSLAVARACRKNVALRNTLSNDVISRVE